MLFSSPVFLVSVRLYHSREKARHVYLTNAKLFRDLTQILVSKGLCLPNVHTSSRSGLACVSRWYYTGSPDYSTCHCKTGAVTKPADR
jgi:hypothetical protein